MPENRSYYYEAMFLIGQAAAADLAGVIEHIKEVLHPRPRRAGGDAQVGMSAAWLTRSRSRNAVSTSWRTSRRPGSQLSHIERDCNLSEKLLRVLILRADHMTIEEMQAADGREALDTEAKLRASQVRDKPEEAVPAGAAPVAEAAPSA
jgi:ribosomal protein S6